MVEHGSRHDDLLFNTQPSNCPATKLIISLILNGSKNCDIAFKVFEADLKYIINMQFYIEVLQQLYYRILEWRITKMQE